MARGPRQGEGAANLRSLRKRFSDASSIGVDLVLRARGLLPLCDSPRWASTARKEPECLRLDAEGRWTARSLDRRTGSRLLSSASARLSVAWSLARQPKPRAPGEGWYRYGDSNPGPVAENHVS